MNKKGFTLIELLAVIVILAVIALIATPIIMNAISNAKQGAWKDAAYGIIKATENAFAKGFSETTYQVDTFFLYENGVMTSYPSGKTIDYKGSAPQDGGIVLHSDGSVTLAIHDGVNCAVKAKTAGTVTVSTSDKATCVSNIYYKQASAPFSNLLTNGDFSSGITNWVAAGSTHSVSNKIMTNISTGIINAGQEWNNTALTYTVGNIVYASAMMLPPAESTAIRLQLEGGQVEQIKWQTSIPGVWQKISGVLTTTKTLTGPRLWLAHIYPNAATATGKSCNISEVVFLNLTSLYGAGNEPTAAQMDNNLNKVWIDSTTNTPKRFTAGGWINF